MSPVNSTITSFFSGNSIASICCTTELQPYCFNCFYSFLEDDMLLIFKSAESSTHAAMLKQNNLIAGTILASTNSLLVNEGAQFQGEATKSSILSKEAAHYYRQYPFAMAMTGAIFTVRIVEITLTQSAYAKRTKHTWKRQ